MSAHRPTILGTQHAVSSGHYLASQAGFRILEQGGNAIDAGVAAGIALNVVLPVHTSFGGVAPILLYDGRTSKVTSISGLGGWPQAASAEFFRAQRGGSLPEGIERVVVPAAADAWLTALREHGTLSFAQVVQPALELAADGFVVGPILARGLAGLAALLGQWPSSGAIFAPAGRPLAAGERLIQTDLATTFRRLIEAERGAERGAGGSRESAIAAARDALYRGPLGAELVDFVRGQGGMLSRDDLEQFAVGHEPPVRGAFGRYQVYANGPWCQGPAFAMALQMLASDDLAALGHNSADYLHLIVETLKLAFADRDAFFGDPSFVDVPIAGLLSPDYTNERRAAVDMAGASRAMPASGDPWSAEGRSAPADYRYKPPPPAAGDAPPDTSYVCVVDRWGNMFSATPSDGLGMVPVVSGLGFIASGRGTQTWLDEGHPCVLRPGKRPRLTPNALLAFRDGAPWMPFGTPGGDAQCQATLQFFLNMTVFGMQPQQAVEAARAISWSFPNSFWPHSYEPGRLDLEQRIAEEVGGALRDRGHDVRWMQRFDRSAGDVCGISRDGAGGALAAAADARADAYAIAR